MNSMKNCKKKLVLINPRGKVNSGLSASEDSLFPPLGLGIIAALTPAEWDIEIIDENFDEFAYKEADLAGITAFTSAAVRAYDIAGIYRSRGIPVVLGGIHPSMMPDEAEQYADAVVIGEAESVWPGLIKDFDRGNLRRRYHGTHEDLAGAVVPRRDLFHPGYNFSSVQTSRGCPMNCSFCSVTAFNGRRYRQRPVNEVLDEIESIPQSMLFFVDDNIIGHGRGAEARALELFKGMVERKLKKSWFCQASINFGSNPEVLKWAARAGCRMVFLGLEAVDETELASMNKNLNIKLEYAAAFKNIHRAGIAVLGAFIFGTDTDTEKSIAGKADYIIRSPIDVFQATTLTPLPGTQLYSRLEAEGRLLYTDYPADWSHYDMTELAFRPKLIDEAAYNKINTDSQSRMLSVSMLTRKFIGTWMRTRSFITAMWALSSNRVYRRAFSKVRTQEMCALPTR